MSRILISGYYGFNNAGDDTVLYGIVSSLRKHNPAIDLAVLSNKPAETEKLFGISAYNRWNMKEIIREIKSSDLLLMGGGSLLQDATSPRSVIYYLGIVKLAKLFKKPVVFYAQGIGPVTQVISKRLIKHIVNQVDIITVRDDDSKQDLQKLKIEKPPIFVTADPALTINPKDFSLKKGQEILEAYQADFDKKFIAISVRHWKNSHLFKKELAKVADHYIEQGWNVVFLPMQYPLDVSATKSILKDMTYHQHAIVLDQDLNYQDIISLIGNMDFVLGMRLHSIILAAVMNVPFVGISYDPKINRFTERIKMPLAGHIDNLNHEVVLQLLTTEIQSLEERKFHLRDHMPDIIEEAEKSSTLTLNILNKQSK